MPPPFLYHPRMLEYDFGPQHPFRPERLSMCVEMLSRFGIHPTDPGPAAEEDALRVHSPEHLGALKLADRMRAGELQGNSENLEMAGRHGFLSSDNPPFPGMSQATLNFVGGTVRGAQRVCAGEPMALTLGGGLHHCSSDRASGFCLIDDPAIACAILRERFSRVAYVDIDLHHGDGVQWIWHNDPSVLTCSIHESGRTLFPGTGFSEETGAEFTALNIPLDAYTTGDVWLAAFRNGILPALERFQPEAIVLQMGADSHFSDPLGHLNVSVQDWLEAVQDVMNLGLPLVACGGGGYNIESVVRMWSAAVLTLSQIPFEDRVPADLAESWGFKTFSDSVVPGPSGRGSAAADRAVDYIHRNHLRGMPKP